MSGFGFNNNDEGIDLSMGLETTGGLGDFTPVPEGTHKFAVIEPPEVSFTKAGETMLVMKLKVVESNVGGAMGLSHTERIIIPGADRQQNEPDKWQTMMKMLRNKLEAITGTPWREDNLKLKPRELSGKVFIATVKHSDRTYTDKEGNIRDGVNVDLKGWQHAQDNQPQQATPVASEGATAASGFKL